MKQKIVMKVGMNGDKYRTKALKFAAVADGVESVAIDGAEKDQVVVIGESVDSVSLAKLLIKKVGHTSLISVEEVKPKPKEDQPSDSGPTPIEWYPPPPYHPMFGPMISYESPNPTGCSIM